ncbi:MAG TPA: NAD(P)-binding domain-containing protein [Candidatus Binatia bacterium]|nr:NAD(P)-binding domain-containing protein [Candidatus Binatia bacterium]
MAFAKIGIMSIGEMGYHWAKLLKARGAEVLTYDRDRSPVTQRRAENAGVKSTASLTELCSSADLIVSIVVPSAALKVAAEIAKAAGDANPKNLIYFDANAISPMTAETINRVVSESGVNFVDGCIIGSASKMDKGAVIYASGPEASRILDLGDYGLSVQVLGSGTSQASAFKVVYAGLTKGLQGLFVELLMGAKRFGLLDEIIKRYDESFPGLLEKVSSSIVGLRIHAGRRAEEMDELQRTYAHYGMQALMAPAIQKVLGSIADLEIGEMSAQGAREGDLMETLELFYQQGLLSNTRLASNASK